MIEFKNKCIDGGGTWTWTKDQSVMRTTTVFTAVFMFVVWTVSLSRILHLDTCHTVSTPFRRMADLARDYQSL